MIKTVYGPKGFGKTKIMIDEVNNAANASKGNVVLIYDKRFPTVDINFNVRCICTNDHKIDNSQAFVGFINGLLAGNSDIEYIYIDGIKRIIGEDLVGGEDIFNAMQELQKEYQNLKFIVSVSATKDELPDYIIPFVK